MTQTLPALDAIPDILDRTQSTASVSVLENLVLGMINGVLTVEELGMTCGVDPNLAQRIIQRLARDGFVRIRNSVYRETVPPKSATLNTEARAVAVESGNFDAEALRNDILSLQSRIEGMNFYEVLGVTPDADRSQIRNAYFALSKKYHPDTYFGRIDAEARNALGAVFQRISVAYDTLSLKSRRAKYDETIAKDIELWRMGSELREAISQRQSSPPVAAVNNAADSPSPRFRVERVDTANAARISRIPFSRDSVIPAPLPDRSSALPFTGSSSIPPCAPPESPVSPVSTPDSSLERMRNQKREQWRRERLQRSIRQQKSVRPSLSSGEDGGAVVRRTDRLMDHARVALDCREYDVAMSHLQLLLKTNPDHVQALEMLDSAQQGKQMMKARDCMRQGRAAFESADHDAAMRSFEKALRLDPANMEARYYLASCLFMQRRDLVRAFDMVKEIVGLGGQKGKYYDLMADLLVIGGDSQRAITALERALKLEPDNRSYQKKMKSLQR